MCQCLNGHSSGDTLSIVHAVMLHCVFFKSIDLLGWDVVVWYLLDKMDKN